MGRVVLFQRDAVRVVRRHGPSGWSEVGPMTVAVNQDWKISATVWFFTFVLWEVTSKVQILFKSFHMLVCPYWCELFGFPFRYSINLLFLFIFKRNSNIFL